MVLVSPCSNMLSNYIHHFKWYTDLGLRDYIYYRKIFTQYISKLDTNLASIQVHVENAKYFKLLVAMTVLRWQ